MYLRLEQKESQSVKSVKKNQNFETDGLFG